MRYHRVFASVAIVAAVMWLAGCTAVQIGEPYDAEIESGLNAYYKSTVQFVKEAQLNAGKAEGRYGSPQSNAFYASSQAALADLRLRAGIIGGNRSCPSIKLAGAAVDAAGVQIGKTAAAIGVDEEPIDMSGNCTTVVIRNVEIAQSALEEDHKEAKWITPAIASLDLADIEAAVRVALQTVRAHR